MGRWLFPAAATSADHRRLVGRASSMGHVTDELEAMWTTFVILRGTTR